jgi:hypothetical protein
MHSGASFRLTLYLAVDLCIHLEATHQCFYPTIQFSADFLFKCNVARSCTVKVRDVGGSGCDLGFLSGLRKGSNFCYGEYLAASG